MAQKFLKVTKRDGSSFIAGPYTKLVRVKSYIRRVMSGAEPLTVWASIPSTHPQTGAPCTMRGREFVSGRDIASITQVESLQNPIAVLEVAPGAAGILRVTERSGLAGVLNLPVGTRLPVERDPVTNARIVWLDASGVRVYNLDERTFYENGVRAGMDEDDAASLSDAEPHRVDDDDDEEFDGDDDGEE